MNRRGAHRLVLPTVGVVPLLEVGGLPLEGGLLLAAVVPLLAVGILRVAEILLAVAEPRLGIQAIVIMATAMILATLIMIILVGVGEIMAQGIMATVGAGITGERLINT